MELITSKFNAWVSEDWLAWVNDIRDEFSYELLRRLFVILVDVRRIIPCDIYFAGIAEWIPAVRHAYSSAHCVCWSVIPSPNGCSYIMH